MSVCKPSEQYLHQLRKRYRKATKKQCGRLLDERVATTGYHRKHALALLRGKRQHRNRQVPLRHPRQRIYTDEDIRAVLGLAELFDEIGSKRLRAAMDVELQTLYQRQYLEVCYACFKRPQVLSPASMDRLRHAERRAPGRRRGGTKPGTLLKSQISVRTFADWDDKRPGFEEIDLVQQDGGNSSGFFACTLNVTDACLGWTEMRAVVTKAQKYVFVALGHIGTDLPFPLLGLDSDNGAEFINDQLIRYCDAEKSPLRAVAPATRTTTPMWNRRIGPSCDAWSAMRAMIRNAK
jgi:hypothetical protein